MCQTLAGDNIFFPKCYFISIDFKPTDHPSFSHICPVKLIIDLVLSNFINSFKFSCNIVSSDLANLLSIGTFSLC